MSLKTKTLRFGLGLFAVAAMARQAAAQSVDARAAIAAQREVQFFRPDDFAINNQPTDHDIVLMEKYDPWYFTAHGEVDATDNAFLTAPKHSDVYAVGTIDGGFESTINESFDLQIGAQISSARFHKYSQLDTDTLAGIISVSKTIDAFRFGTDFIPSVYYGRGFDDKSLSSYEWAVWGRYTMSVCGNSTAVTYARLSRRWADPDDFTNSRFAVTEAVQHQCTPSLTVTAGITFAYSVYDDFFESTTGKRRKDFLISPFVSAVYQINRLCDVGVSLSYGRSYSTVDSVDYEAADVSPYIEVNLRF